MRTFNYSAIKNQKWDSEILGLIAAIYKEAGKQELYLKQRPDELEKLVEIAKIQSTEASNAIEGIVTTNTRIRQLVEEKTTPRNRDEQEIAGYRDVLSIIHESYDAIPLSKNYILQLHKIMYSHMNNPMAGQTKNVQNYKREADVFNPSKQEEYFAWMIDKCDELSNALVQVGEMDEEAQEKDKFTKLKQYLENCGKTELILTFADIEAIIGCTLCKSAYNYSAYWNPSPTHTMPNTILSAGYKIVSVDLISKELVMQKQ